MTETELKERCAYWQRILRLQDWRIVVRLCDTAELGNAQGCCETHLADREAIIRLLKPAAYDLTTEWAKAFPHYRGDLEITLVHEMLHILTWQRIEDKNEDEDEFHHAAHEQAMNTLAAALVSLDRQSRAA